MPQFNEDEIRAALSTAKDRLRVRASLLPQADVSARQRSLANLRSDFEGLLTSLLTSSGHTLDEVNKIRERYQAEMHRSLQEEKAAIISSSASLRDFLQEDVANWRKTRERWTSLRKDEVAGRINWPEFVFLDTPLFIVPFHRGSSEDIATETYTIAPYNSIAKFTGDWHNDLAGHHMFFGSGDPQGAGVGVSFVYVWQNASDKYVVINAESSVMYQGLCTLYANSNSVAGYNSGAYVGGPSLSLGVLEMWNQPATWNNVPVDYRRWLSVSSGFLGAYDMGFKADTLGVNRMQLLIPPNGMTAFTVDLSILPFAFNGSITADFLSGDWGTVCPGVVLAIVS